MKKIKLSKGLVCIVDDCDFEYLNQWKWSADSKGYAFRRESMKVDTNRSTIIMHRVITECPDNSLVDHINGNVLDNRSCNLRVCSVSDNMRNRKVAKNSKSGYKGVHYRRDRNRWVASIKLSNSRVLAHTKTPEEAAYIYDQVSIQLWGEFARTNIL